MLKHYLFLSTVIVLITFSCKPSSKGDEATATNQLPTDTVAALAGQAYLYGYSLVLLYESMRKATNMEAPVWNSAYAPINQFGHFRSFPDATFKDVVKPNCDTYYSIAFLDLETEPMVLTVPNTGGRYYLLPMLDAYTNVFASPGKRTTGTEAGTFLVTGPGYAGAVPDSMKQIKAPTNLVWVLGRTQVNNAKDGSTIVKNIQDGYLLSPLSQYGKAYTPAKHTIDPSIGDTPPPVKVEGMDVETFFNELNQLLAKYPPPAADSTILKSISAIGIGAGQHFSLAGFDTTTQNVLKQVPARVIQALKDAAANRGANLENGWSVTRQGVGNYGMHFQMRAVIALIGLGANLNEDASYPTCQTDENGENFNGSNKYVIHFEKGQTPPVNAFWSITMYGMDDLLIANPINRFAIGDRDKLKYNKDGSLDIYIQHDSPGKDKEANWLSAGRDGFTLTMRLYWPKEEFLNGSWKIPPVRKV